MTAPKDTAEQSPSSVSFEQSMDRLSQIVKKLEGGELPLEQSLQLFEEGVRLSRMAQSRLDSAQQRIERLLTVDAQGRARTAPFETTADTAPSSSSRGEEDPPF